MNIASIHQNLSKIEARIQMACRNSDRKRSEITLIGASKKQSVSKIITAVENGLHNLGENYLQEGLEKQKKLQEHKQKAVWHFIGPIQSKKCNQIARNFDYVHSVDREEVAKKLDRSAREYQKILDIFIQVNIDNSPTKSGVSTNQVFELVQQVSSFPHLQIRGLMVIPDPGPNPYPTFLKTFELQSTLNQKLNLSSPLKSLSMGMSNDFESAIKAGATHIRIGTLLFGERT